MTSPATGSSVSTSVLRAQMQFIIVKLSRRSLQTNKEKMGETKEIELPGLCPRVLSSGTPLILQISGYEMRNLNKKTLYNPFLGPFLL